MISLILEVLSFVLFLIAAFVNPIPRVNLGWLGAACWVLSVILAGK